MASLEEEDKGGVKTLKVNNSQCYLKLAENSHSRSLATIPIQDSNQFLVGLSSQNSPSKIAKVLYDENSKNLTSSIIINFGSLTDSSVDKIDNSQDYINEVYGIYPRSSYDFYTQVYNLSKNEYELKFCLYDSSSEKYIINSLPNCHTSSLFTINNYTNNSNILYFISSNQLEIIDLSTNNITGLIPLYENNTNPIKIASDIPTTDSSIISIGINSDIFICDNRDQKISSHIKHSHDNALLSLQYDPFNQFILCTSGNDYSIKFWDIRMIDRCIGGIYNNPHWIWNCKYNKIYSNVLVTVSSSYIVRNIIFSKIDGYEGGNNNEEEGYKSEFSNIDKNLNDYSFIDYCEFEDSVYDVDWLNNDYWTFAAVSFNSNFHINSIPDDIKYKIMI